MSQQLAALGWSPSRQEEFQPYSAEGLAPARVTAQHRGAYVVYTETGARPAKVGGRLRHRAAAPADLPAVGDWVALRDRPDASAATVHAVLDRTTAFSRKAAGDETLEQVVAANVDVVFLVSAFGHDLNARRLERYLTAGWDSGADPVVVLNKLDVADDPARDLADVEAVAFGVPVHAVSAADGAGLEQLSRYFDGDRTVALLGSSGVGKSSIVNRLLGATARTWARSGTTAEGGIPRPTASCSPSRSAVSSSTPPACGSWACGKRMGASTRRSPTSPSSPPAAASATAPTSGSRAARCSSR